MGTLVAFEGMPVDGLKEVKVRSDTPVEIAQELVTLHTHDASWNRLSRQVIAYSRRHFALDAVRSRVNSLASKRNPAIRR